ncbi:hypothetical protein D9M69_572790 [compost metagenome]
MALPVTAQLPGEVGEAHVVGDQHALGPGQQFATGCGHWLADRAIEAGALTGFNDPRSAAALGRLQGHPAAEHRDLRPARLLAHQEAGAKRPHQPLGSGHQQGPRILAAVDQDLPVDQAQQAALAVHPHIHGAGGIEGQVRAVGQADLAAFAGGGAQIGAPDPPRLLAQGAVAGHADAQ